MKTLLVDTDRNPRLIPETELDKKILKQSILASAGTKFWNISIKCKLYFDTVAKATIFIDLIRVDNNGIGHGKLIINPVSSRFKDDLVYPISFWVEENGEYLQGIYEIKRCPLVHYDFVNVLPYTPILYVNN